jgi:hypothetical protein
MASNHGVVYLGAGKVEVQSIDYPELKTPQGKKIDHGVIIKPITTRVSRELRGGRKAYSMHSRLIFLRRLGLRRERKQREK